MNKIALPKGFLCMIVCTAVVLSGVSSLYADIDLTVKRNLEKIYNSQYEYKKNQGRFAENLYSLGIELYDDCEYNYEIESARISSFEAIAYNGEVLVRVDHRRKYTTVSLTYSFKKPEDEARHYLNLIFERQKAYFSAHNRFSPNLYGLELYLPSNLKYTYKIEKSNDFKFRAAAFHNYDRWIVTQTGQVNRTFGHDEHPLKTVLADILSSQEAYRKRYGTYCNDFKTLDIDIPRTVKEEFEIIYANQETFVGYQYFDDDVWFFTNSGGNLHKGTPENEVEVSLNLIAILQMDYHQRKGRFTDNLKALGYKELPFARAKLYIDYADRDNFKAWAEYGGDKWYIDKSGDIDKYINHADRPDHEAKAVLKQLYTLERAYKQQNQTYTTNMSLLNPHFPENRVCRYIITHADKNSFMIKAVTPANTIWTIDNEGLLKKSSGEEKGYGTVPEYLKKACLKQWQFRDTYGFFAGEFRDLEVGIPVSFGYKFTVKKYNDDRFHIFASGNGEKWSVNESGHIRNLTAARRKFDESEVRKDLKYIYTWQRSYKQENGKYGRSFVEIGAEPPHESYFEYRMEDVDSDNFRAAAYNDYQKWCINEKCRVTDVSEISKNAHIILKQIYALQNSYKERHGRYADNLEELGVRIPDNIEIVFDIKDANKSAFTAAAWGEEDLWTVNENGWIDSPPYEERKQPTDSEREDEKKQKDTEEKKEIKNLPGWMRKK